MEHSETVKHFARNTKGIVLYEDFWNELKALDKELIEKTCIKNINEKIWFLNTRSDYIEIGLNICATGRISAKEADIFGYCIQTAAKLAENFKYNGYYLSYED